MTDPRRRLPGVDRVLTLPAAEPLLADHPRALVVRAVRAALDSLRGDPSELDGLNEEGMLTLVLDQAKQSVRAAARPGLRPVLNATGVILHTNLGRAPLAASALERIHSVARGYSNLEFDLETGTRGSRYSHCRALLRELSGAEDGLVVNNAAAALILALSTVAGGRGVAVSRGELIEIGGGFRIPEIVEAAGTRLFEVGTTNRTRPVDYERVDDPALAALLKVHRSNFRLEGFQEEVSAAELADLGRGRGLPVVYDLGSGAVLPVHAPGLPSEPTVAEAVDSGADLVVFSGDKLLGGPQAGVLVGSAEWIGRARKNPLCRALRVDGLTLAALESTLALYRDEAGARDALPALRMIHLDEEAVRARAAAWAEQLGPIADVDITVVDHAAVVGGGTLPGSEIPSAALRLVPGAGVEPLASRLRAGTPSVVGRVQEGALLLDPRTVLPEDDRAIVDAIRAALAFGE